MIIEETDVSSQETFPVEAVFYQLPGGLDHHLRAVHEKTVTEEILQSARRMSQDLVAQETLRNIKTLSSAGQADKTSRYIECTVYIEAEGPNEGETRADSDQNQSERKLTFFAKREKEAAKYCCLYLQHKGTLRSMEDRTKSCVVVVKSCNLLAKYLAWNSSSKLYLEQPTVQGWILHCKDFWENFRFSGFLCYKFIVLLSDFTLSIRFVTSEMKE